MAIYDCLYSGLLPNEQANFASAQVFLGLTPGLLATLGPSIGEISLLSLQRPLLSFFLALGGPAIYVPRLLTYDDPLSNLQLTTTIFPLAISLPSATTGTLLSVFQYILAMLATANVVQLSWQLGYRTVIAWKCNSSYLPFLWSTLPAVIHLCSSISWRWSQPMRQLKRDDPNAPVPLCKIKSWAEWLRRDFTLSVNTKKRNLLKLCHDNDVGVSNDPVTVFFNQAAGLMSFLHILFGTLVFSSLMFIATLDAMNVIARYLISGLACKLVVAYELNGMRIVETRRPVDEEPGEIKPPNS
ncbi:hypothetical protein AOQ84DRAFT_437698 [Glonium stellatum]|uniref:Uncharacterized protein n=1 Tax=Glonium stellatum TaxID=574774 RepID=A0A8E2JW70_9PEZI|nr:hypothetical protein AOQ84DRAFT_437698 [Glonium stellatum]